jgi:hydrogenase nickel incorporation protein HypA/HybF
MHELSLAMEVISLASREAGKSGLAVIQEILIEVGDLSGVDADAFQWGLEMLAKDSILAQAEIKLIRTTGKGRCSECDLEFEMKIRTDNCPVCHCFPSAITGGEEFRVVSLVAE